MLLFLNFAEASSEFTNLLTENEILKASLDQLANEKVSLIGQLRGAQDQAAIRAQEESQAVASFQVSSFGWNEKMTSLQMKRLVVQCEGFVLFSWLMRRQSG